MVVSVYGQTLPAPIPSSPATLELTPLEYLLVDGGTCAQYHVRYDANNGNYQSKIARPYQTRSDARQKVKCMQHSPVSQGPALLTNGTLARCLVLFFLRRIHARASSDNGSIHARQGVRRMGRQRN